MVGAPSESVAERRWNAYRQGSRRCSPSVSLHHLDQSGGYPGADRAAAAGANRAPRVAFLPG